MSDFSNTIINIATYIKRTSIKVLYAWPSGNAEVFLILRSLDRFYLVVYLHLHSLHFCWKLSRFKISTDFIHWNDTVDVGVYLYHIRALLYKICSFQSLCFYTWRYYLVWCYISFILCYMYITSRCVLICITFKVKI